VRVDTVRGKDKLQQLPNVPDCRLAQDAGQAHKQLDAVVISTPDHMHAPITLAAIQLGKHVYCEKPLAHTIGECRRVAQATAKHKVVTQTGNGGNATPSARRAVELLRSAPIGDISEIHCWTDRPRGSGSRVSTARPTRAGAADPGVGPVARRRTPSGRITRRTSRKWRGWYDFGTGPMGDMGAHICNIAFWALDLRDPVWVDCQTSEPYEETFPQWSRITWQFPAREGRPAMRLHWYDGGQKPAATSLKERRCPTTARCSSAARASSTSRVRTAKTPFCSRKAVRGVQASAQDAARLARPSRGMGGRLQGG